MDIRAKVEEIVNSLFEDDHYFIVDILVSPGESIKKISVLIDNDQGLSIDACAKISRKLGAALEELNLLDNAYHLEVSSPGVDKPLNGKRQYLKNVGRRLAVMLHDNTIKEGILEGVSGEDTVRLNMEVPNKANKKKKDLITIDIPLSHIKKSNVIVSFK